jgi:hypothetical protein
MEGASFLEGWGYFTDWQDLLLAVGGLVAVALNIIWWSQQTRHWHRIAILTFLVAFALSFASLYLFWVPPYYAGCSAGCTGWRGFPLPVARITFDGQTQIGLIDVLLNTLLLWLLVLVASLIGRIAAVIFEFENRPRRLRTVALLLFVLIPWALLPRYLDPPQPPTTGEELRLVTNARRAAEMTYGITGLWVHRLALEDLRQLSPNPLGEQTPDLTAVRSQVCLRGYTYFYVPWRRYRVSLEPTGVNALAIVELPLGGPCWDDAPATQ